MSAFITPSTGSASLVRGSGTLQGWTSYTPPTAAIGNWTMISMPPNDTLYQFTVQVDGATPVIFSFTNDGAPGDGSTFLGSPSGDPETDALTLLSGIDGAFSVTASSDGEGNFSLTSNTLGSTSQVSITGPGGFGGGNGAGNSAVGPSGQISTVTLVSAVSGKTTRIVSVYASASNIETPWNGTLILAYGNGGPIFSQAFSISDGVLIFPGTAATLYLADLQTGWASQSITATFLSTGNDDAANFIGGFLNLAVICDQQ